VLKRFFLPNLKRLKRYFKGEKKRFLYHLYLPTILFSLFAEKALLSGRLTFIFEKKLNKYLKKNCLKLENLFANKELNQNFMYKEKK